ncbi:MAG: tryptophan-rich sensory protein [Pseudomonadota bacterium]
MSLFPPRRSTPLQVLGLVAALALCYAVAGLGAAASVQARDFYAALVRPAWAPPGWVFAPVWSALFTAMAVAAWLVWRTPTSRPRARLVALGLFAVQLAFNALWSWLFFGWHLGGAALAEVLLLWLLIAATTVAFRRVQPLAAWLLVPYLLWVAFASVLNFVLWRANPGVLG